MGGGRRGGRRLRVTDPGLSGPPELELAFDAHDLDWRGEPGAPALAGTAAVREWLGRTSAIGRLFLTQRTPFECRLRALQIPNLDWAPEPPGHPSPCQFTLDEGDVVIPEGQAPRPGGGLIASCRDDRITVTDDVDMSSPSFEAAPRHGVRTDG